LNESTPETIKRMQHPRMTVPNVHTPKNAQLQSFHQRFRKPILRMREIRDKWREWKRKRWDLENDQVYGI
jgi:hypothetical protein